MQNNRNIPLLILLLISFLFSIFTVYVYGTNSKDISAKAAILYSSDRDEIIYGKNEDLKLPMASTTKIMTALIAIEKCDLDSTVTVTKDAAGIEGSSVYLKENDTLSVKDLIYSILLQSANDAAAALAIEIGGDIEGFAKIMNEKAESIGLKNTSFQNPHGLDNENHYTTAYDLSLLASYALNNDTFRQIASTYKYSFTINDSPRIIVNHNKLLKRYDGCIGVKTGYTKKSGRCLVSAAERDGVRLVAVTLNAPDDWNDHESLYDFGFSLLRAVPLSSICPLEYRIKLLGAKDNEVSGIAKDKNIIIKNNEEIKLQTEIVPYVCAPVCEGDNLGRINVIINGNKTDSIDINSKNSIKKQK